MDNAARPRKDISTDDLLKIAARIRICNYGENTIRHLDADGDKIVNIHSICFHGLFFLPS